MLNFEKKLKEEIKKHTYFEEKLKHHCITNIDWIKEKTSTYIEIQEQVINEMKIQYNQQIDRLNMIIEDYDSR